MTIMPMQKAIIAIMMIGQNGIPNQDGPHHICLPPYRAVTLVAGVEAAH